MRTYRWLQLLGSIAFATSVAACGSGTSRTPMDQDPDPENGGQGGQNRGGSGGNRTGGSGGSQSTGGSGGGSATGGTGGGMNNGGAGGSSPTDGPRADAPSGGADAGPSTGDGGGGNNTLPSFATCKSTAPASLTPAPKLNFVRIDLMGLPAVTIINDKTYDNGPTELRFLPNAPSEFLYAMKGGFINHFKMETGNKATFIKRYTLPMPFSPTEDCGLLSMAFDPDFATNKFVYVGYCTTAKSSKVARFTWDPAGAGLTNARDIITFMEPTSANAWHAMGSIGFDKDKNMWIVHGEFTVGANAQNTTKNLGKLLRIVPNRDPNMGGHQPAPGNPYLNHATNDKNIYAYGLRSPWKAVHDAQGRWLIGDIGPSVWEEVNLVTAPGQNFAWDGNLAGKCVSNCTGKTDPITAYRPPSAQRDDDPYAGRATVPAEQAAENGGRAVWVANPYLDCGNDRYGGKLTGVYLFGDLFAGWVRGMLIDATGKKTADEKLAFFQGASAWAQGADGYLYVTKFGKYHTGLAASEMPGLYRVELAP